VVPLSEEVDALGSLVRQFAETLASHDAALAQLPRQGLAAPAAPVARAAPAPVAPPKAMQTAQGKPLFDPDGPLGGMPVEDATALVRRALADGRLEVHLQPIVSLPQRKAVFYEVLTRLRLSDGSLLMPADFLGLARQARLMPQIDILAVMRAVQIQRRLKGASRDIGLFCNLSPQTLADATASRQLLAYMDANKVLSGHLVFELSQETLKNLSGDELERLAALREAGFRLCLDQLVDLRLAPGELAERGVRFIKVPAHMLLADPSNAVSDVHPSDLGRLLGRYGIDLIAERIEKESEVPDILDTEARFGQGFLFSPPRPVRGDALTPDDAPSMTVAPAPPKAVARPAPTRPSAPAEPPQRNAVEEVIGDQQSVGAAVLAAALQATGPASRRAATLSQGVRALVRSAAGQKALS
jgi:cyclic-di-GMP phosphodiesterase TipF (flagellum assembly factor)